jgi:hypothetical protein
MRTCAMLLVAGVVSFAATEAQSARNRYNGFSVANAAISVDEIHRGGPPRDGIPSIDHPKFIAPEDADFLQAADEVLSISIKGETRAYPLRILVQHEIVNDTIAGKPIAITYCPLCGTAMVFSRKVGDRTLDFGVSGLLYQSDVLMYDRQTDSLWSQLAMSAVSGPLVKSTLTWLPSQQLAWKAWKARYPLGKVLSADTGFQRDYSGNAYARYKQSPDTMFPVPSYRTELPRKEWVVGVLVDGVARAYPIRALSEKRSVQDAVNGIALEITYDPATRLAAARENASGEALPVVKLYWFAWQAFYPDTELWKVPLPKGKTP